jgi:hypothetical protein
MLKKLTKTLPPPRLPWNEAFRIAKLARVTPSDRELFRDCACGIAEGIWPSDQQAVPAKPSPALIKAAKVLQALREAELRLGSQDRAWVKRILEREPSGFMLQFEDMAQTIWKLDFIFSTATGTPMRSHGHGQLSNRGRKRGSVSNSAFQKLVQDLLLAAHVSGGELTLDKNFKKGSLIEALEILRSYLPPRLIPHALPFGTIQKIKTRFNQRPH